MSLEDLRRKTHQNEAYKTRSQTLSKADTENRRVSGGSRSFIYIIALNNPCGLTSYRRLPASGKYTNVLHISLNPFTTTEEEEETGGTRGPKKQQQKNKQQKNTSSNPPSPEHHRKEKKNGKLNRSLAKNGAGGAAVRFAVQTLAITW